MAETPAEYDKRKCEALDFEPSCDVTGCEQRASQGARCAECGSVRMIMCGAHAGRAQRNLRERPKATRCEDCGATGFTPASLEFRPLQGWFA